MKSTWPALKSARPDLFSYRRYREFPCRFALVSGVGMGSASFCQMLPLTVWSSRFRIRTDGTRNPTQSSVKRRLAACKLPARKESIAWQRLHFPQSVPLQPHGPKGVWQEKPHAPAAQGNTRAPEPDTCGNETPPRPL